MENKELDNNTVQDNENKEQVILTPEEKKAREMEAAKRLQTYKDLLDNGAINKREFNEKKRSILADLGITDYRTKRAEENKAKAKALEDKYNEAISLANESKYDDAIVILEELEDYKDCESRIELYNGFINQYNRCVEIIEKEDKENYAVAIELLKQNIDYKDSKELIEKLEKLIKKSNKKSNKQRKRKQVLVFIIAVILTLGVVAGVGIYFIENNYEDAFRYTDNGQYAKAQEMFHKFSWYRDSAENENNVRKLNEASNYMKQDNYAKAKELLEPLARKNFSKSKEMLAECNAKLK